MKILKRNYNCYICLSNHLWYCILHCIGQNNVREQNKNQKKKRKTKKLGLIGQFRYIDSEEGQKYQLVFSSP